MYVHMQKKCISFVKNFFRATEYNNGFFRNKLWICQSSSLRLLIHILLPAQIVTHNSVTTFRIIFGQIVPLSSFESKKYSFFQYL